jgi:hypothetical protein
MNCYPIVFCVLYIYHDLRIIETGHMFFCFIIHIGQHIIKRIDSIDTLLYINQVYHSNIDESYILLNYRYRTEEMPSAFLLRNARLRWFPLLRASLRTWIIRNIHYHGLISLKAVDFQREILPSSLSCNIAIIPIIEPILPLLIIIIGN